MITSDSVTGILRAVLASAGGILIGLGWFDAATWSWISGAILTLVAAGWSIYTNRPASLAASAQAIPGVSVSTSSAAPPGVKAAIDAVKRSS